MKFAFIRPRRINFKLKKYVYLLNDFTNFILKKEREDDKRRIKNLTIALIILIVVIIISFAYNVYLATGA
jgi:hypothetical protein